MSIAMNKGTPNFNSILLSPVHAVFILENTKLACYGYIKM